MNANTRTALRTAPSAERGFTLVEIMVVVVILGLLATMVATNVFTVSETADESKAKTDLKLIHDGVKTYKLLNRRLPESLDELVEPNEKGQSILESLPDDPWGNPYVLVEGETSRTFEVISWGPDGDEETEDDLSSREKRDD